MPTLSPTAILAVYQNADQNAYTTASVTTVAGRGYLLSVATPNTNSITPVKPTVTGAGETWTELTDWLYDNSGGDRTRITVFVVNSASGGTGALTIDYGGVTQDGCMYVMSEWTGHNTSALVNSGNIVKVGGNTSVTTLSASLAALASSSNVAFGVICHQANEGTTVGTGFTALNSVAGIQPVRSLKTEYQLNVTTVDASWTTSSAAGMIAMELQVAGGPNNTVAPAVTGNKYTGQTLTSTTGTWTGSGSITYAYQWQRDGSNIGGATSSTHVLVSGDETHSITCVITATDSGGSVSATSNAIVAGPSYTATAYMRDEFCAYEVVTYTAGFTVLAPPITVIRIAPGSGAGDVSPAWVDVSALVRSFTYTRGRQTELDQAEVGTASIVFDNSTRVLDPSYTAGPFYPRLLPNMQVSIQASYGSIQYDLFRGYVQRFSTSYVGPNYAETTYECVDGLSALSNVTFVGTFDRESTGARVFEVIGAAGWPTTAAPTGWTLDTDALNATTTLGVGAPVNVIDDGVSEVEAATFTSADNKRVLDHIRDVVGSEPGRFFINGSGVVVFQDRSHVVPVPDDPQLVLSDDATDPTAIGYRNVVVNYELDQIHNDIELSASNGTVASSFDATSIDRYWRRTLSRQTQIPPGDSDLYQQAGWLLRQKKDPLLRILSVTVDAFDTVSFRALHPLDLGDVITVNRTPPGVTDELISQDSFIERLTVTAVPGPKWTFQFELSSFLPEPPPWLLGYSALDSATLTFA